MSNALKGMTAQYYWSDFAPRGRGLGIRTSTAVNLPSRTSDRALCESSNEKRVVPSNVVLTETAVTVRIEAVRRVNQGKGNRTRSACCPMSKRANGQPPIRRPVDAVTAKDLYWPGGCGIASDSPAARVTQASVRPGPRLASALVPDSADDHEALHAYSLSGERWRAGAIACII